MKKYALVRVDGKCPDEFEKINNKFVCEINGDFKPACKNCRYGDTKEQLIRKVETAIKRKSRRGESLFSFLDKKYRIEKVFDIKVLAKEIIEFLGVEE